MKYTVIVGGNPYVVVADSWVSTGTGMVQFVDNDDAPPKLVAEFKGDRIDGFIQEDNNLE